MVIYDLEKKCCIVSIPRANMVTPDPDRQHTGEGNMSYILSTIQIDMEDLLDDLAIDWIDHKEYVNNGTAFHKTVRKGDYLMCCCPYHDEDIPSFGVRAEYPYDFNCFGCGVHGGLDSLVAYVKNLPTILHGLHYIQKTYIIVSSQDRPKFDLEKHLHGGNLLDKKRSLPDEEATKFTSLRHSYIEKRGFSDRTLRTYEVGYDEHTQAITFPVRTAKGLLRFINRRSVLAKKFLNEKGIYKKDILYGLWYIIKSPRPIERICLNESITDTMSCYESGLPACAIMGRILFKEQMREMLIAGIKEVDLFFDNDKAGLHCTLDTMEMLSTTPIRVNVVIFPGGHFGIDSTDPDGLRYKDANDLLLGKAMHRIERIPAVAFRTRIRSAVMEAYKETKLNQ
jgi:DNA primase